MLENWCFDEDGLTKMSKHYQTGEPLPKDLVQALIKSRDANAGLTNLRQIFFATFDYTIHTIKDGEKIDIPKVWSDLRKEITLINNPPGSCGASTFGHVIGGYDSGYYGYLWSLVFAADLFSVFKENNFAPEIGKRYREKILQPGGSIDGMDILVGFLGREPNNAAFLKQLGLDANPKL
jgi:Zn-dependent oligopeptidase